MPAPDTKLIIIHPEPFDHDQLHRIGQELQRLLAGTLTKPLPKDVLRQLYRLERVDLANRVAGLNRPPAFRYFEPIDYIDAADVDADLRLGGKPSASAGPRLARHGKAKAAAN